MAPLEMVYLSCVGLFGRTTPPYRARKCVNAKWENASRPSQAHCNGSSGVIPRSHDRGYNMDHEVRDTPLTTRSESCSQPSPWPASIQAYTRITSDNPYNTINSDRLTKTTVSIGFHAHHIIAYHLKHGYHIHNKH